MAEPFDYVAELQRIQMCLPLLAMVDLDRIEKTIQDVDTLGPILDPTAYMRGRKNVDPQIELVRAAAPLIRLAKKWAAAEAARA